MILRYSRDLRIYWKIESRTKVLLTGPHFSKAWVTYICHFLVKCAEANSPWNLRHPPLKLCASQTSGVSVTKPVYATYLCCNYIISLNIMSTDIYVIVKIKNGHFCTNLDCSFGRIWSKWVLWKMILCSIMDDWSNSKIMGKFLRVLRLHLHCSTSIFKFTQHFKEMVVIALQF